LYAAGIIFLEILTDRAPSGLYSLFPEILKQNLPRSALVCLRSCLEEDPQKRTSFQEMFTELTDDARKFTGDAEKKFKSWTSIKLMEWNEKKLLTEGSEMAV
jgi:hypothetical protein